MFNSRIQEDGKLAADFITVLYTLSKTFGQLNDEIIRYRIIVGVCDKRLSTKLQLENELTFERAVSLTKQI